VPLRIPAEIAQRVRQLPAGALIHGGTSEGQEQRCRQNQERRRFQAIEAANDLIRDFVIDAAAYAVNEQISQA